MKQRLTQRLAPLQARLHSQWRASPAPGLWRAWLHELRQSLPARWRDRLLPQVNERSIRWPLSEPLDSAPGERLVLLLPADTVMAQTLQLPLAAIRDLHSVVGFELDKYTPFPRERMHYVARLQSRGKTQAQVLLVAIVQERLTQMLDQCRDRGLTFVAVDGLDRAGQPLGVDLLPADRRPPRSGHDRLTRYLALGCVALTLTCMLLWLDARSDRLASMQDSVAAQREQVQQVQALRQELANTQGAARYLAQQKAAKPTLTSVLVDLTGCLGADTWIEQLEIAEDGTLSISGQSAKASTLITRVKACQTLVDARFQGIIQPDEKTAKERFSLRAQLRKEPADAP